MRATALTLLLLLPPVAARAAASQDQTTEAASYSIGVGDVVAVTVWKNPELSVTAPVRPDGKISLPLVGEVEVAGRTPAEVQTSLGASYEQFITAPAVSVVITQINSRKVFISGEVAQPGVYDILQPTRLMQLLAMAGGLTPYAKQNRIIVLRSTGGQEQRFEVSIKAITDEGRLEHNIQLQPGDTIIVP